MASTAEQRNITSFFKNIYSSVSKKRSPESSSPAAAANLRKSKSEIHLRDLEKKAPTVASGGRGLRSGGSKRFVDTERGAASSPIEIGNVDSTKARDALPSTLTMPAGELPSSTARSLDSGTESRRSRFSPDSLAASISSGISSPQEVKSAPLHLSPSSSRSPVPISPESRLKYVSSSPETFSCGSASLESDSPSPSSASKHVGRNAEKVQQSPTSLWKDDNGYSYARPEELHSPPARNSERNRKASTRAIGSDSVQTSPELKHSASVGGRVVRESNFLVSDANSSSSTSRRRQFSPSSSFVAAEEPLQSVGNNYRSSSAKYSSNVLQKEWPSAPDPLESISSSKSSTRGSNLSRVSHERHSETLAATNWREEDAAVAGKQSRSLLKRTLSFGKKHLFRSNSDIEKDDPEKVKSPRVLFRSRSIDFDKNPATKGFFKTLRKDKINDSSHTPLESAEATEQSHHNRRRSFDSFRNLFNTSQKPDTQRAARDELTSPAAVISRESTRAEELSKTSEDKRASSHRRTAEEQQKSNAGEGRPARTSAQLSTYVPSKADVNEHVTGLSPDLWRNVFSFLPRQQILGDLRAVCRDWKAVIDSPLFVPHVKQYHLLDCARKNSSLTERAARVERWIAECELTSVVGLLSHLQRDPFSSAPALLPSSLMRQYQTIHNNDSMMLECWSNCISTMDVLLKEFDGNMWCLALVLILFVSEGPVLQEVLDILLSGKAGACCVDALEFVYLILTAITAPCWQDGRQPLLRELESAIRYVEFAQNKHSLQGGVFCFTTEQLEILNTQLSKDKAFPGTGKSTTLLEYAKRRPESTFAYLIFDRVITTEGEMALAPNTKSINFQKLAYAKVGWQYRHKLQSSNLSALLVKTVLGVSSHAAIYFILLTLEQFLRSSDLTVKDYHVPRKAVDCTCDGVPLDISYCMDMADKLWRLMIDKGSREIPMTHNGYLKLYQLSEPRLDQFDCLLCDEVQNASPVMIDIVLSQTGCSKIFVGDPHQQIHGFKDEEDPLQKAKEEFGVFHLKLTLAFRFSPEIASTCNVLLQLKEEKTTIVGVKSVSNKYATVIGNVRSDLSITGRERGAQKGQQVTVVARTHARVFEAAVQCSRRKLGFVGGIKGYHFDLMRDTWYLMKGNHAKIQDLYIKSFVSFAKMVEVAQQTGDLELLARIKIVEAYHGDLPKKLEAIRAADVGADLTSAEVVFSTAHKVKGLEFNVVALTNDFLEMSPVQSMDGKFFVDGGMKQVDVQEVNLLYVAASRAKTRLLLNADLHNYLDLHAAGLRGEPRPLLMHVKDAMSCTSCLRECTSQLVIVAGRLIEFSSGELDNNHLLPDVMLQGTPSSVGRPHDLQSWRICMCLTCARQPQTVPANLAAAVKMIASIFS